MNQRQTQILMIASLFVAVTTLLISPTFLGVIQPEETIGGTPVSVGDVLTLVTLFSVVVTIGAWATSALKKREKD